MQVAKRKIIVSFGYIQNVLSNLRGLLMLISKIKFNIMSTMFGASAKDDAIKAVDLIFDYYGGVERKVCLSESSRVGLNGNPNTCHVVSQRYFVADIGYYTFYQYFSNDSYGFENSSNYYEVGSTPDKLQSQIDKLKIEITYEKKEEQIDYMMYQIAQSTGQEVSISLITPSGEKFYNLKLTGGWFLSGGVISREEMTESFRSSEILNRPHSSEYICRIM